MSFVYSGHSRAPVHQLPNVLRGIQKRSAIAFWLMPAILQMSLTDLCEAVRLRKFDGVSKSLPS